MKTRNLKIEACGDFWQGRVTPKIRLAGHWLERAGFKPGCRVEVQFIEPGKLALKSVDTSEGRADILHGPAPAAAWLWQGVLELGHPNYHDEGESRSETK